MALEEGEKGPGRTEYPAANTRSEARLKVLRGGGTGGWETTEDGRWQVQPLTWRRTKDERNNRVSCDLDVLDRSQDMDIAAEERSATMPSSLARHSCATLTSQRGLFGYDWRSRLRI
jgi:hypothetical protein